MGNPSHKILSVVGKILHRGFSPLDSSSIHIKDMEILRHRLTPEKGVHQFRFFLSTMHTPNSIVVFVHEQTTVYIRVNPLKTYDNLALNFFLVLEFLLDVIIYSDTDQLRSVTRKSET